MPGRRPDQNHLRQALYGSLAGGVVFGVLMHMMDMMPMVGMLVRVESVLVGWLVHLAISAAFAVPLAFLFGALSWHKVAIGALWGVIAWVGGALVLMPLLLGMPGMVFNLSGTTPWMSLMGHLLYGVVAGAVATAVARTSGHTSAPRAVA